MSNHTENLVILFADICGSTALYDHLGDQMAQRLMASCIGLMRQQVVQHQGVVIKTIGDEVMCSFASPTIAVQAACAMQTAVQNARFEGGNSMRIKIGLHYGSVICDGGDVFGDTVNVAARIASHSRANQIMTSTAVVQALPEALRQKSHRLMAAEFKGKEVEFDIFIVKWDEEDQASTQIRPPSNPVAHRVEPNNELTLHYAGKNYSVNKDRKKLIFGRGDTCDIVIASTLTSRQHAGIELRFGKFFVVDQSTNGTYVRNSDGNISHITRQEMILHGQGSISPGQSYAENPTELIQFSIS
ncbi:MAG: hypothetical protein RL748_869 [Pseudomonadota bacterium]|jgi:class 3 adenylate cyclase